MLISKGFPLEVPFIANYILKKFKKVDGILTTGCLIKGETNHFDNISKIVAEQLTILSVKFNTPNFFWNCKR
ncbi:MAG: hypothetical protein Ct9H90mP22_9140 [Gammaproteobacteria bacterium]|nr:MAG: hypothetical protein Ct9H90mP22_9140 [Gammaproteobacteria bacterium]